MPRIVFLLISIIALVSGQVSIQSNGTTTEPTTNKTTIEPITNATTTEPITNATTTEPITNKTTTSTVAPTTTTPIPTIPPTESPEQWIGNVTQNNKTCIKAQFKVQITIKYNNTNGTEETTGFNIPINATVNQQDSYCSSNDSQPEAIVIGFVDKEYTSANLTLKFNSSQDGVFVEQVELSYNLTKELFPSYLHPDQYNKIVKVSKSDLKLFKVAKQSSYSCSDAQTALLDNDGSSLLPKEAKIDFTSSRVEAYMEKNDGQFDDAVDCAVVKISDVVPIAVGASLAGLVIIVLIAYFIGRRRSRRLAYQSV